MDEGKQLRKAVTRRAETAVSVGDVLCGFMENSVSPQHSRYELIAEAWRRLLPVELGRHCRIDGITGGRLKVLADSPSYMYELQLLSRELLEELGRCHPAARIREMKVAIG